MMTVVNNLAAKSQSGARRKLVNMYTSVFAFFVRTAELREAKYK